MRARGVDYSPVQARVDCGLLRAAGYDFVSIRGTIGASGYDVSMPQRVQEARDADLVIANVYHVLTVETSPAEQAKNVLSHWQDHGAPISVDFELPDPAHWTGKITPEWLMEHCLETCDRISQAGPIVLVYSYPDYEHRLPVNPQMLSLSRKYDLWWASYPHEKSEPADGEWCKVRDHWRRPPFWQYSGNGGLPAPGIPQVVDHDLFDGDRAALLRWLDPKRDQIIADDDQPILLHVDPDSEPPKPPPEEA